MGYVERVLSRHARRTGPLAVALAIALLASALVATLPRAEAAPSLVAHGSARQVWLTGLPAGAKLSLLDRRGHRIATQRADAQGGLLFRDVRPGKGYRVRRDATGQLSPRVRVHTNRAKPWNPGVYDQEIPSNGYGYLTTRDGTKLAISVHPPTSPASLGIGLPAGVELPNLGLDYTPPYPTLIEYSGYGTATPDGPENGIATLANLMGFAVVDVSMRGTGCSGGAFDFFEPLQNLDGYDVIETIARQPWVKGGKVGMMGISYGAISQLFTAQLNPPSLAAISPLSTIDSVATTLFPGGIINTGFALEWAKERVHDALPAGPDAGQPWAWEQIQSGDETCAENQKLHGQAIDLLGKIRANAHYIPRTADPLDPISFVHKIKVPTFLACQWQDEQTGGHCPALVRHFTGTKKAWFTFTNGAHVDSLDPATLNRWYDFLSLYVAKQSPAVNAAVVQATAPLVYQTALGVPPSDELTLPRDPIQGKLAYAAALSAFEKLPKVRVLFENGAGDSPALGLLTANDGNPYPAYEHTFARFPVGGTQARSWYLAPGGRLADAPQRKARAERFQARPRAIPATNFTGGTGTGGLWGNASQWSWDWRQRPAGTSVSYVSKPFGADTTVLGAGAVYAWVRSSARSVDLQATVSEVRPDGTETFVQSGWVRGNERALAKGEDNVLKQKSTLLEPVLSLREADVRPMPADRFVRVPIPLYFSGHPYRAGSRLRVTISAPNGDQPIWAFATAQPRGADGSTTVAIGHSRAMPSRLVLPVVRRLGVPTALPDCGVLRNQPCRAYVARPNRTAHVR